MIGKRTSIQLSHKNHIKQKKNNRGLRKVCIGKKNYF